MSETVFSIRLNPSLLRVAAKQASLSGESLEDWLAAIILKHIAEMHSSDRLVPSDIECAQADSMAELLDRGGDNPPDPGDELPEGYVPLSKR